MMVYFNLNTVKKQKVPFMAPTVRYILENSDEVVLRKLMQTCKLFYARTNINLCDEFICHPAIEGMKKNDGENIATGYNTVLDVNRLFIFGALAFVGGTNPRSLSDFIPNIYDITVTHATITKQQITSDELEFLIGHGNIKHLDLWNVTDAGGKNFDLEDIMRMVPCAKSVIIKHASTTKETSNILSQLPFKMKMTYLSFYLSTDELDPAKFAEFITKNCASDAEIHLNFGNGVIEDYLNRFDEIVSAAIRVKWIDENDRPTFNVA